MSFEPKEDRRAEHTPIGACAIYTHRIKCHTPVRTYWLHLPGSALLASLYDGMYIFVWRAVQGPLHFAGCGYPHPFCSARSAILLPAWSLGPFAL